MWLDSLRIISILAVVMLHVSAVFIYNYTVGSQEWIVANILDSSLRWCVPVFIMISGSLLLDSRGDDSIFQFYRKRLNKVLIPLVFWSFFYSAWRMLRSYISTGSIDVVDILLDAINGEAFYHLWFIFMILGLYTLTPFFRSIVKLINESDYFFFVLFLSALSIVSKLFYEYNGHDEFFAFNNFLYYVPYFFLGHFLNKISWKPSLNSSIFVFVFSWFLTAFGCWYFSSLYSLSVGLYFYENATVNVLFMSISIFLFARDYAKIHINKTFVTGCAKLVFGVYLIHPFFLDIFLYKKIIISSLGVYPSMIVFFILVTFFSFAVSFLFGRFSLTRRLV
jgi:surface polysaccharide O-acyltransferase-like enzyme